MPQSKQLTAEQLADIEFKERCKHFFPTALATKELGKKKTMVEASLFDIEYSAIDFTEKPMDNQPPQQQFFGEKSEAYMEAWRWLCRTQPGSQEQAQALHAVHEATEHCPKCGARATNGHCWLGCGNEAALESQREVDAAIIAAYDKPASHLPIDETFDSEPACGNFREEEAAFYAHPD